MKTGGRPERRVRVRAPGRENVMRPDRGRPGWPVRLGVPGREEGAEDRGETTGVRRMAWSPDGAKNTASWTAG